MEAALGPLPPTLCGAPARAHGGRHGALTQGPQTLPVPLPRPLGIAAAAPPRSGVVDPGPDGASRAALHAQLPWPPRPQPTAEPQQDPAKDLGNMLVPRREPLPSWAEALPPLGAELARVDRTAADLILRLLSLNPARRAPVTGRPSYVFMRAAV